MGDFSDFQRGQIVGVRLAGSSVTKMAILLGVSKTAVSKVRTSYTNHEKTSPPKRNSGRKQKLSERDRHSLKRTLTINRRSTAAKVTAELNIHLEDCSYTTSLTRVSQIQHPW
jgi:transposase